MSRDIWPKGSDQRCLEFKPENAGVEGENGFGIEEIAVECRVECLCGMRKSKDFELIVGEQWEQLKSLQEQEEQYLDHPDEFPRPGAVAHNLEK